MSFFKSNKKVKQKEEILALTQARDDLQRSEEDSKKKLNDAEEKSNDLQRSIDILSIENTELKNKLHTEEQNKQINSERDDLLDDNNTKTIKIKELESEKQAMAETIEISKTDQDKISTDKESLVQEIETYKQKLAELETEREEFENRIDDLEKRNVEFEDEMVKLREEFEKIKSEKEDLNKLVHEEQDNEVKQNRQYIEDMRRELTESRNKIEGMLLESEALKSENESLFRANESKKDEIDEIQKEVGSIKNELQLEKLRYIKIRDEWDQEKNRTEFVLVSKSAKKKHNHQLESFREENDSEDEHVLDIVDTTHKEMESMKEHEKEFRKRINQLQIDKEELFRSGTNLFTENKSLKNKYDQTVDERTTLLQVEAALKRKLRGQEREINDLKKTIDDLYYQNMAIRSNDERENNRGSYVVVMGNEMIKQLEREKSALYRRVKFLERENNEIESRVNGLEKQSVDLVSHSKKYDKHSNFHEASRSREREYRELPRSHERRKDYTPERGSHRITAREHRSDTYVDYHPPPSKPLSYHEYRESQRPTTIIATKSPDYYKSNAPPFSNSTSRQPSIGPASIRSMQSHGPRVVLPHIGSRITLSSGTRTQSPKNHEPRRVSPLTKKR